jgi:hypothetical protein
MDGESDVGVATILTSSFEFFEVLCLTSITYLHLNYFSRQSFEWEKAASECSSQPLFTTKSFE